MQNLILAAALVPMFVFGWFLMKRLDCFLEKNRQAQILLLESNKDSLRIGFSNLSIADSISAVLEQYTKQYSGISIYLFHGTEQELIKQLFSHNLNVIFLAKEADIPADLHYNVREVRLSCTPVMMTYGGLAIEPIAEGWMMQKVLWPQETQAAFVEYFVECLQDELDALKLQ